MTEQPLPASSTTAASSPAGGGPVQILLAAAVHIGLLSGAGIVLLAASLPAAVAWAFAPSEAPPATLQEGRAQRPTDVTVIMSTSRGKYDGTYRLSQISRLCGELKADENMSGVPVFVVEFPDDGDFEINDVTFSSKTLVAGVTTTDEFYLSVNLKSPKIGHPAACVLDTTRPKNTGRATLAVTGGTVRLKVDGVNDRGETVDLTVVCKPAVVSAR